MSLIDEFIKKSIVGARRAPGSPEPGPGTTAPAAPTNVDATAADQSALVTFDTSDSGGSPILSCTATSSPGSITGAASGSPILVTGLTNGVAYTFTVTATNAIGTSDPSVASDSVTPEPADTVPDAPTIGTATAGDAQATVAFTAPAFDGGAAIEQYIVTSSPGGITAVGASSPITVTGLTNGTAYAFVVRAQNSEGVGAGSDASAPVTPTGLPGVPSITSVTIGSAELTFAFSAPTNDGGSAITGYRVEVDPTDYYAEGASSPLTVTGLTNGIQYTARIRATNSYGDGPWSAQSAPYTPIGVPGAPTIGTATAGVSSASVAFTAPSYTGGSAITGYTATATPGGLTGTGTSSPITVSGLTNGVAYTFKVKATNAAGTGSESSASNSVTPANVPGKPTSVVATPDNAQASVAFTAPASNGGSAITGYTATSSPGGFTKSGASSPLVVTGLTNDVEYTFTVVATNAIGNSLSSDPSSAVIPYTVPAAPTGVSAAVNGAESMAVSFTAGADNGRDITSFTVTSNPGSITASGSSSPITVTGLTRDTSYTFTVTATNAAGEGPASSASAAVTAKGVPDAPTIGTATAGDTEASVAFSAPANNGGAAITSYTVRSNPASGSASGASSPLTVTGLVNGVDYTFNVTATNTYGESDVSENSNSVTPSGDPGVPEITDVERAGSGAISVTFDAANSNGSPITEYTITSSPGSITGTGAQSPITVSGLTNGTTYTFTMTATNANGTSASSVPSAEIVPATVPDAPTIGTATAGDAQASVAFTAPASNGGAAITGYTATASPGNATGSGSASPITVQGLANGVEYTFTVTATNEVGTSAASSASNAVTPVQSTTVPGAPTNVAATKGNASATVTFTPPGNTGGSAITGYTATSSPGGLTGTGSSSPVTVSGLTNGTAYTFTVTATNSSGVGPASAPSNSVTPSTVPGAPTIGTATAGDTQATVTFTAPASNGGSTITGYTVTSSPGSRTATGTGSPLTVTGLTNGTSYTFTVTATNANGTGAASAASNSVTPAAATTGPFDALYASTWTPVTGNAPSYTTTSGSEAGMLSDDITRPYLAMPGKLTSLSSGYSTDPAFDTKIWRLAQHSDLPAAAGDSFIRHEYSRRTCFSKSGEYYFLFSSGAYLWAFNAETGQRIDGGKTYPDSAIGAVGAPGGSGSIGASIHVRDPCDWYPSPIDGEDNIVWIHPRGKGWKVYRYDFVNHTYTTLFDLETKVKALSSRFNTADGCNMGGEGRPSNDGRYWGFKVGVMNSSGASNSDTPLGLIVYDRVADAITGWVATDTNPNNVTMSSDGTYIIASDVDSGTYEQCEASTNLNYRGTQRWNRTFTSRKTMNVTSVHADPGHDVNGNEVYVSVIYNNGSYIGLRDGTVFYCRCDTGQFVPLFNMYYRPNNADAAISNAHYSTNMDPEHPGWCLISTYHDTRRGDFAWKDNVVFYCKLEPTGNPEIRFVAHHRSVRSTTVGYRQEPQATADRSGLRVVFASSWNNSDGDPYGEAGDTIYSFMVGLPSWFFGDSTPPADPDNLLTNGGFDGGSSGWTITNGGWTPNASGGMTFTQNAAGGSSMTQPYAFVEGTTYRVTFDITSYTGPGDCALRFEGGTTALPPVNYNTVGTHSADIVANAGNNTFVLRAFGSFNGSVDNVRMVEVDTGPVNLLPNGTFDNSTGWSLPSGVTVDSGSMHAANQSSNVSINYDTTSLGLTAGTYEVYYDLLAGDGDVAGGLTKGNLTIRFNNSVSYAGTTRTDVLGTDFMDTIVIDVALTQLQVRVTRQDAAMNIRIDNIRLYKVS